NASPSLPAPNTAIRLFSNMRFLLLASGPPFIDGCALSGLRSAAAFLLPAGPPRFPVKRNHSIVCPRNVNRTYWQKCGGQRRSCSIPADEKFLLLLALRRHSRRNPLASSSADA